VSQFLQFLQQNTHLIVVFIFLLGGFFSWLSKTLKEQAEAKRARERYERSKLESLRTGRPASSPEITEVVLVEPEVSPAQRRLQEIAERRKRQLDELRARAASKQGSPSPRTAAESTAASPAAPGRDLDARRSEAAKRLERQKARQREAARQQESAQREREEGERREMLARAAQAARREASRREAAANQEAQTAALRDAGYASPAANAPSRAKAASLGMLLGRMTRDDLRKAIVLQEIFGTPVGARPPEEIGARS
jgi:hypothetical protein